MNYFCGRKISFILVGTATFIFLFILTPHSIVHASTLSWYNQNWSKRVKISIAAPQIAETVQNFPTFINLSALDANFFSLVKSDGSDIRITKADGVSELPFELVSIDTINKTGELHFKADILSATTTSEFYIYFGNVAAQTITATSTYGRNAVWTDYRAVYHGDSELDSTGHGFTLVNHNGTPFNTAKMGKGFDGGSNNINKSLSYEGDVVTADEVATGDTKAGIQIQMWAYPYNANKFTWLWGLRAGPSPLRTVRTAWLPNSTFQYQYEFTLPDPINATSNSWNFLVYSASGNQVSSYSNGQLLNNATYASFANAGSYNNFGILHTNNEEAEEPFNGIIDEVRILTSPKSASWLRTEYNNQSNPNTFYSTSTSETVLNGCEKLSQKLTCCHLPLWNEHIKATISCGKPI